MSLSAATAARSKPSAQLQRIDPRVDPEAWVANNERITNECDLDGWLALYAPDAVFESITDGAYDRVEGLPAIRESARILVDVFRRYRLSVKKRFVAATPEVVVNTWSGGFGRRERQFGTEIWTLRDGLVVRHEQYTYTDVRPSAAAWPRLRALLAGEVRVKLAIGRAVARMR